MALIPIQGGCREITARVVSLWMLPDERVILVTHITRESSPFIEPIHQVVNRFGFPDLGQTSPALAKKILRSTLIYEASRWLNLRNHISPFEIARLAVDLRNLERFKQQLEDLLHREVQLNHPVFIGSHLLIEKQRKMAQIIRAKKNQVQELTQRLASYPSNLPSEIERHHQVIKNLDEQLKILNPEALDVLQSLLVTKKNPSFIVKEVVNSISQTDQKNLNSQLFIDPIHLDTFEDPQLLGCGHSLSKISVDSMEDPLTCPLCRFKTPKGAIIPNDPLQKLLTFFQNQSVGPITPLMTLRTLQKNPLFPKLQETKAALATTLALNQRMITTYEFKEVLQKEILALQQKFLSGLISIEDSLKLLTLEEFHKYAPYREVPQAEEFLLAYRAGDPQVKQQFEEAYLQLGYFRKLEHGKVWAALNETEQESLQKNENFWIKNKIFSSKIQKLFDVIKINFCFTTY